MPKPVALKLAVCSLLVLSQAVSASATETTTKHVVLITIDGLRWQEVFAGADERLLSRETGGVRDVDKIRNEFWAESPLERRTRLMPFLWEVIAKKGQLFGDVDAASVVRVTNGRYFSYPGYNEILCGFGDETIDSNAKRPNKNITVLEWLNQNVRYRSRVAAFGSWDVFPYILNQERSGIYVNSGWQDLEVFDDERDRKQWNQLANSLPRVWTGVRYDAFTARGATEYLRVKRPRVLYVALGETDDWAHDGRYDLYLDAALRSDQYIQELWDTCQRLDEYRNKTTFVITTDHGRGDVRDGWKSHGVSVPGSEYIWIAVLGPDTEAIGQRMNVTVTQSQVAATVAALLGEDFSALDSRIAPPIPGIINGSEK
ncbi:MAG: alkaline phosphatase family protein [Planctomycetaceae bacterium]|nr:alkaline phosphatase family protein [Planctomycetales bacterium]MCB9921412.1 alkaline phosphatase family protein [Planctomycetaceae bacterium]